MKHNNLCALCPTLHLDYALFDYGAAVNVLAPQTSDHALWITSVDSRQHETPKSWMKTRNATQKSVLNEKSFILFPSVAVVFHVFSPRSWVRMQLFQHQTPQLAVRFHLPLLPDTLTMPKTTWKTKFICIYRLHRGITKSNLETCLDGRSIQPRTKSGIRLTESFIFHFPVADKIAQ